ncbi:MAG: peptide transporter, partial [Oscillospiraceae bacterium]|nr:peptide transporter [Oscillospiraceae bacterium]
LYSLSKIRENYLKLKYLFCGANGNIGLAWKEAAEVLGFELEQCCPNGYEMRNISVHHDLTQAIKGKDVICTDSLPSAALKDFTPFRITESAMRQANKNALLNPCPPFFRGEEVSADAIDSEFFVGYEFKKNLLIVQQAIMIYCLTH